MEAHRITEPTQKEQNEALEKAKMSILFHYERITGQNLYGCFPDKSIWNTLNYQKAAHAAHTNATHFKRHLVAQMIKTHLLK